MKRSLLALLLLLCLSPAPALFAATPGTGSGELPSYVRRGLKDYETKGYEAAVRTWLAGSPYEPATEMVSRIAFFKNIEKLYGKYTHYDLVFTKQTPTSNQVYIRMNFERTSGYILFTSARRNHKWVLADIDLDHLQKYGSNVPAS
jgi:uncharacterized protein YktA (UPF0223 family)